MQIPKGRITFSDQPIAGSMCENTDTDIVTSQIVSSPIMWIPCCLIIFLLTLLCLNRNNIFRLCLYHEWITGWLTRMCFQLIKVIKRWVPVIEYGRTCEGHAPQRTHKLPRKSSLIPWNSKDIRAKNRYRVISFFVEISY